MEYDTAFFSILNQMKFHLGQNRKDNCHHDHIPFNVKGNENIVFSVQRPLTQITVDGIAAGGSCDDVLSKILCQKAIGGFIFCLPAYWGSR